MRLAPMLRSFFNVRIFSINCSLSFLLEELGAFLLISQSPSIHFVNTGLKLIQIFYIRRLKIDTAL